jgi:hypothetical protein
MGTSLELLIGDFRLQIADYVGATLWLALNASNEPEPAWCALSGTSVGITPTESAI